MSEGSVGDLQDEADEAQPEADKPQQNIEDAEDAQEDSSNSQNVDSSDMESESSDISNGKLSADEVNLRLRQLVTSDHKQQVIILGVQLSFPDMTAFWRQEEEQAQAAQEQKIYTAQTTDATTSVDDEVQSTNGIFIDLVTRNILFLTGRAYQN